MAALKSNVAAHILRQRADIVDRLGSEDYLYGYTPTPYICYIFLGIFGVSTVLHLGWAIWYRRWFMLLTATSCGVGELLGWAGRLWSSYNVGACTAFMIQISCTVISPTFLVAANFIIFGVIVQYLGQQYSRIQSRLYTRIFVGCDIIALAIQGTGGGVASSASDNAETARLGGNITLAGVMFQLVSIVVYTGLTTEFLIRYKSKRPIPGHQLPFAAVVELSQRDSSTTTLRVRGEDPEKQENGQILRRIKIMAFAMGFSTLAILIRSIY